MSDGHGHILFCNADLTQGQFFFLFTLSHYWIMWVWGWRNVLFNKMKTHFSRHKCIDGNTQRTPYILLLSQAPLDTWRYKVIWEFIGPGAASKTFLPFCRPACDTPSESERRKTPKKTPKQSAFVWQTPSSPHMKSSPYMWYRRGRSIQAEVMRSVFWLNAIIPTPKMKSCGGIQWGRGLLWFHSVYIMPTGRWSCLGPVGAAVVMNHSRDVGWLK